MRTKRRPRRHERRLRGIGRTASPGRVGWSGRFGWIGRRCGAALGLAAAAGCAVGQGSPDGWRYLSTGTVAVAHPKTWRESGDGAVLRARSGRTDAALTVTPGGGADYLETVPADGREKRSSRGAAIQARAVPAPGYVRREVLRIGGHPAQVLTWAQPVADGRPAGHVEVHAADAAGRPVVIRAWAVDGTADDPSLLREIVNSIEFTTHRPR
jgi:hypothetical protein